MEDTPKRIQELQDKLFQEYLYPGEVQLTKAEWNELCSYERDHWDNQDLHETIIAEMFITSHPDYGEPDKDGFIKII
ncbi:MAG: hypothetical protein KAR19_14425 [Bacteroidales bacterium]|nr:hypothetical protein [Bacteroidales bacterium]